jgi:HD-GYP domain-containing protein (c-di-GMP phosphodiesterase class II)
MGQLMQVYYDIVNRVNDPNKILDYLYTLVHGEDDLTHAHCLNSALIAGVFASWMNLSLENTNILIQCAFCYDIGKLKLPNALLWKPGKLTDVEFMKIKTHTMLGFDLLKDSSLNHHIIKATLMHHERCDGTGYPSKLKGPQIDTYAKLVAIIDSYEAMSSPRAYREPKHPFEVIASFEETGLDKYDRQMISPLLRRIAEHMVGNTVTLNNGAVVVVSQIKPDQISKPIVQTADGFMVDLSMNESLKIQGLC